MFEVKDGRRRALFAAGAGVPYALNDARAASLARDKAFCAKAMEAAGVPCVPGRMFFVTERWAEMRSPGREPADARAYAAAADYPLFCKPISGSNGLFAEVIADCDAFEDYLCRVSREHFAILVQPFLRGVEHRVFMLNGEALFCYRKELPCLAGDGRSTLKELLAALPRDTVPAQTRARDSAGSLLAMHDRPAFGARIILEGPANRAAGGGATDLREGSPEPLAQIARAAVNAIGLSLAGVDIFDLSPQGDLSELTVIEVNSNPMIQTLEDGGRWDLITTIWRANFESALK